MGKTDLLLNLVDADIEVIIADSMQVYRYMDIGTAKPPPEVLSLLPHHLINIVDPDAQFNAGEFVRRAGEIIKEIYQRNRIPVLAGGTAFYLRNFIYGLPLSPAADSRIKSRLRERLKERGLPFLVEELRKVDPVSAAAIGNKDSYRIIRALEVYGSTGKPLSAFRSPEAPRKNYLFLIIGLKRDRAGLYERIEKRVDLMFENGLREEIISLIEQGYTADDPGMKGIGYREFFIMQKGCLTLKGVRELIKRNSRRYAKRQITFFKSLPGVQWFNPEETAEIKKVIIEFLRT